MHLLVPAPPSLACQEVHVVRIAVQRFFPALFCLSAGLVTPGSAAAQGTAPAAPSTASAATPAAASAPSDVATDADGQYNRELLTLEEEVHALKEQVFRSKATLQLLKEIVVKGSSGGARASLIHINELSASYKIESVTYTLDGQGKYNKADPTGQLNAQKELKVWEGTIPPGNHNLTVNFQLRGNGFGVFSYVQDYTFNVQSTTTFNAEQGKSCSVKVIADEQKGFGRSFVERPTVRFEPQCIRLEDVEGGSK